MTEHQRDYTQFDRLLIAIYLCTIFYAIFIN